MHLTFLGTGAATSVPLAFCRCPSCQAARLLRGKNIRRRSALLVNDDLLIDLGPDVVQAMLAFGKELTAVRTLLVTHAHSDHFDPGHLVTRMADYGCQTPEPLLVCCSETGLRRLSDALEREETGARLDTEHGRALLHADVRACAPGETFACGPYTVTALYSRHDPAVDSRLYVVDDGKTRLLYATDTPALDEDFYAALAACGGPLDCAVLDHTYGPNLPDSGAGRPRPDHMTAHDAARAAELLRKRGLIKPDAPVFATHISHEGTPPHDELDAFARAHGYRIAWDGMEMEL